VTNQAPGLSLHLLLVGLPGAGKTTTGRHLATKLGRSFIDFDESIELQFGKPVSKIFQEEGERVFRTAEVTLSYTLATPGTPPKVLAPGGGWITNLEAVAHLRPVSRIIYLRVSPTEALTHLGQGLSSRPLFATGDPAEVMRTLYDSRRSYYEAAADLTIETEGLGRDALLTKVVELVSSTWDLNLES
jgi:shikimate kinase